MLDAVVILIYFFVVVITGLWAASFTKTTDDFFFAGRRFSWWPIAFSCVATLVGSYSFIQYSQLGFNFGLSSLSSYTNDWFVMPLFLMVWLPILYFNNIKTVPEYFKRRFDEPTKNMVVIMLLVYLVGYIGVNLLTIGVAIKSIIGHNEILKAVFGTSTFSKLWSMNGMLDWNIIVPATIIAIFSGLYLHAGGQNSVLITDFLQGLLLLAAGVFVVVTGISYVGGLDLFWSSLPLSHKLPFADFSSPSNFHSTGVFWSDGIVGTYAFYCINQGVLMRFLSAKSVTEGRKSMLFVVAVLMPIAAIAVGGAGWVGTAMVKHSLLPVGSSKEIFIRVAQVICSPGVYGLVVAAVIAALMSTLDSLITAVTAIVVNDIIRHRRPDKSDEYYLKKAKNISLFVTLLGLVLVPIFDQFGSIYRALSHFTSMVIPPLIIVMLMGMFTKKFSAKAALITLIAGAFALLISLIFPAVIKPFAHGVHSDNFSFMRSFYGLVSSGIIALICLVFFPRSDESKQGDIKTLGLTICTIKDALPRYNKMESTLNALLKSKPLIPVIDNLSSGVGLSPTIMDSLNLSDGDRVYLTDARWFLGGLRATYTTVYQTHNIDQTIKISTTVFKKGNFLPGKKLILERLS
ncbi:MAG: sodium:solute symporter family protein [Bacteriovoracaceae bacterium]|nr:sodium:solute symporter family protein [Bacteriovoracaceae bacterium]